jgi:hypothetical protein
MHFEISMAFKRQFADWKPRKALVIRFVVNCLALVAAFREILRDLAQATLHRPVPALVMMGDGKAAPFRLRLPEIFV